MDLIQNFGNVEEVVAAIRSSLKLSEMLHSATQDVEVCEIGSMTLSNTLHFLYKLVQDGRVAESLDRKIHPANWFNSSPDIMAQLTQVGTLLCFFILCVSVCGHR
jgi:hypothetical protein